MPGPPPPTLAIIIPVRRAFNYCRAAVSTAFQHSPPDTRVLILDDNSPPQVGHNWDAFLAPFPADRLLFHRFPAQGGLTRSWNHGLVLAREINASIAIATNSDVLFSPGWDTGIRARLAEGVDLLGPVTNCPGFTNRGRQGVRHFIPDYRVNDQPAAIAAAAQRLRGRYPHHFHEDRINGFFLAAYTRRWWEGAFSPAAVFDPKFPLTGNEDELQDRWEAQGAKIGFTASSFIFHYRSASRGMRHRTPGWAVRRTS